MIEPYLRRLGLTSGQAWTLSLGIVLGGVLLATSLPPVLDQRHRLVAQAEPVAAPVASITPDPAAAVGPQDVGLRVVESGFATSGTTDGARVPVGALPVAVDKGVPTTTSYVRLAGNQSRLVLVASPDGSSGPSSPSLQACRNRTADWRAGRPGPAVPFDAGACAPGVLGAGGRYTFDLSRFTARNDPRGFAVAAVPGGSTQSYRVSLTPLRSTS